MYRNIYWCVCFIFDKRIVTSLLIYFYTIGSSIENKMYKNELWNYTENYLFYLAINMDFYFQF